MRKIKKEVKNIDNKSLLIRTIILIITLLVGLLLTPFLSALLQMLFHGVNYRQAMLSIMNDVGGLRLMQGVQTLCVFVLPAFVFCWIFRESPSSFLSIKKAQGVDFLIAFVCVLASVPVINLLMQWNESMQFPEWLSGVERWMRESEDRATYATNLLMSGTTIADYLACLLVVSILAGFGEELIFRGIIQRLLLDALDRKSRESIPESPSSSYLYMAQQKKYLPSAKSETWAIWLTAIIFSIIHFQFYGFIPRMLMGAWFGYLLWWTGSIWVPIFAHFLNNALSMSFSFAANIGWIKPDFGDNIGTGSSWWLCLISLFLFAICVLYYRYPSSRR